MLQSTASAPDGPEDFGVAMWMKAQKAADYAGGVSPKILYSAVRAGKLRAAKIGAGRNLLFCEAFIDQWLQRSAGEPVETLATQRAMRRVG